MFVLLMCQEVEQLQVEDQKDIKRMDATQLSTALAQLEEQIKEIEKYKKEYVGLGDKVSETESEEVILTGTKRLSMTFVIAYYEYHNRYPQGFTIHPESKKVLNEINYALQNNLPIRKDVRV